MHVVGQLEHTEITVDCVRLLSSNNTSPDIADWEAYEAARQKPIPNVSLNSPALRYRVAPQRQTPWREINVRKVIHDRRRFSGAAVMTIAPTELVMLASADAQSS